MLFDRETDYAIRLMRALVPGEVKSVASLCASQLVPRQFAYKILGKLEERGLTSSRRGPNGGYALTRDPGEISLFEVVDAISDSAMLNECLRDGALCPLNSGEAPCPIHNALAAMQKDLENALKSRFLSEFA